VSRKRTVFALLLSACGSKQPPAEPVEAPRLDAVEACMHPAPAASALPVPVRPPDAYPWAELGFRDAAGWHPATFLCDLPDRVVALAVRGKGGTASSVVRGAGGVMGAAKTVSILPSSKGCVPGSVTCTWDTGLPDAPSIDTLKGPQWVPTSGWVHGAEDMCRALPDDTIAVCSTATRLAYVELGCTEPGAAVQVQLGLHDESLPRSYDLDVEVPVARLYGTGQGDAQGDRWTYRFTGAGKPAAASLVIDLAAHTGVLEVDGARQECIAFGLYRR